MESCQTILFLGANSTGTNSSQLDQEVRDIQEGINRSQQRGQFQFQQRWVVQSRDIHRAILDFQPQIVHFAGYGAEGIILKNDSGINELIPGHALAGLFQLFQLNCVVLNGCYSKMQAEAIIKHIPYVVGLDQVNDNRARISFAVGFYDALGAGREVEFAFNLGKAAIGMEGVSRCAVPVLHKKSICKEATDNNARKLDKLLRSLNYDDQINEMKIAICGSEIAKVVSVQVNGDFTKRWLVKRLALQVPNHDQSNGFSIAAKPNWNNSEKGLTFFWESLYRTATMSSHEPAEMIQELQDRCMDRPLLMAIHGIQVLEGETLQKILAVFWEPLINEISSQSWSYDHGDCILFLTTDLNKHPSIEAINPACGVDLAPWDCVKGRDMIQLLKCNELKKMIHDCSNETTYLLPAGTKDCDLLGLPQDMLTKICSAVDLSSCADLEPYWKIAL